MVIWSQPAKADLRSIHDFIANDSRFYAKKGKDGVLYFVSGNWIARREVNRMPLVLKQRAKCKTLRRRVATFCR